MSVSQLLYKNIFTGELFDNIFSNGFSSDLIPSIDDVFNIGNDVKRWNNLYIDNIFSSSSPVIDASTTQGYILTTIWDNIPIGNTPNIMKGFTYNNSNGSFTYTGPNKTIKITAIAQFVRNASNGNAAVAITINSNPVSVGVCHIDNTTQTAQAIVEKILTITNGQVLRIQCSTSAISIFLQSTTINGYSTPSICLNVSEVITN
jgi:hypothetical protein